ncbi:MAG: UvrD-helicase domain-containing protein [Caldilineaceae bacterium]|nr:UvrD-helicase domain-containing protein [Caldilineaceae bacterium]
MLKDPSALLTSLNPQQAYAVQTITGPVLVLAGPGSGKTGVLTRRIAYLVEVAGVAPWNILAVTFTNKAAREMRERVEKLLEEKFGPPLPDQARSRLGGLTIGTFHSICARILRVETDAVGYDRNWVIYDSADQLALIRNILRDLNLDEKRYSPNAIQARISNQKNELVTPLDYRANSYFEEIAGRVYVRYQEALQINNAMDFDDLLLKTVLLFRQRPDLLDKYQKKWPYLMVDEFQDTNKVQYELIHLLANAPGGNRNLFVVGDEDQSIYRWRGADYQNVVRFRQHYPDATVILLEQNYRSTQTILDVANSVISNNRNRTAKQLHTENKLGKDGVIVYEAYNEIEEAAYICDEIERLLLKDARLGLGDFAVMYRTNAQSRALEEVFVRRQIKHKLVGATRFYERKEIKDALCYLRLVHNPTDTVAMDRIINEPARGIGTKTYAALKEWAAAVGVSEYTALLILRHGPAVVSQVLGGLLPATAHKLPDMGARAKNALSDFARLLEGWITLREAGRYESVADLLDLIMRDAGYVDMLRDGTDEGEDRFANLQELRGVAAQYVPGMPALEEGMTPISLFLQEVSLVSDQDQVDEGGGAVTLLTLHTAKGLEFPVVFMVGLEEGILPHSRSMESSDPEDMAEERRLCYVGITRAKQRLYLIHAYRRNLWGSTEVQEASRFLEEIPADLLSGMVNRQERKRTAYARATTWGDDDERTGNRSDSRTNTGRNPYNWSSQRDSPRAGEKATGASKQTYWSPEENPPITRPTRTSAEKAKAATDGRTPQFNRRDSVQHGKFGVGTVIESQLTRDDEEVTIAFPGIGIKKLLVSMAGLKKL